MKNLRIAVFILVGFFLSACSTGNKEVCEDVFAMALLFSVSSLDSPNDSEILYISKYAERHGCTESQFKEAFELLKKAKTADTYQIMRNFDEIVGLIKSDGVVTENEKIYLINLSADPNNPEKNKVLGVIENIEGEVEVDNFTMAMLVSAVALTSGSEESFSQYSKQRGLNEAQLVTVGKWLFETKDMSKIKVPSDINKKMRVVDEVVGFIKSDGVVTEKEKEILISLAGDLNIEKEKVLAKL